MAASTWLLGLGCMFTLFSLAFVAISFSTDNWVNVTVDRIKLSSTMTGYFTTPYFFTRNRGLFRTCYEGNETKFLDTATNVVDGNCLTQQGYELNRNPDTINYGKDYNTRIQLMRCHFAFFICSMVFLIIGTLVGIVGCWRVKVLILQIAGLLVFVGAFFAAAGMAFFHGYDYLEREKINKPGDFKYFIERNFATTIYPNSLWAYGYSYMLGWVGVGCAIIGAILFLVASFNISNEINRKKKLEKREEKKYQPNPYDAAPYPYGYGNSGYMEDPYSAYSTGYAPSYYPTQSYPAITY